MTAASQRSLAEASRERALPVLLVPAYEPPSLLPELLQGALATGRFSSAIVVDDGSSAAREMIPQLLSLSSSGYAFELDMLLRCRGGRGIREVPIQTVYAAGNQTSHFDPIRDSMRIYWVLLRFFFASLFSAVIDNLVFAAAYLALPQLAACQLAARLSGSSSLSDPSPPAPSPTGNRPKRVRACGCDSLR